MVKTSLKNHSKRLLALFLALLTVLGFFGNIMPAYAGFATVVELLLQASADMWRLTIFLSELAKYLNAALHSNH